MMTDGKSWPITSGDHSLRGLYKLKKTLGKGHYAVVKLAHHVFTGEKVAIKVIDKTKLDSISAEHLYHEVKCMKLVKHPNVVRLYEVINTETKLYLILELGDGGDMYDYIMKHDQGLSEDKARDYFAQIVRAISYCHKLHVVHRDLKPENVVFFESQGIVKLTDFGFSNCYSPGQKLSTSCGSLAYSAPEILLGEEYDAPAVDVWSLGVILYMLVCGEAPFNEANDSETLTNIMDCRYTILDHVSAECRDLIDQMIIRNPGQRISLEEIQNHAWLKNAHVDVAVPYLPLVTKEQITTEMHVEITHQMVQGNLALLSEIEDAIDQDRYDHITSTYFLIAERLMRKDQPASEPMDTDEAPYSEPHTGNKLIKKKPILIPQKPDVNLQGSVANSPPCQQAYLTHKILKPQTSSVEDVVPSLENIVEDSESASSSSSSLPQKLHSSPGHQHHHKKPSPSYPREHLTITPRHGFSVVKGGIDTLIEEEERSRSQTTTDDEDDGIIGEDDSHTLNPQQLATRLQRAASIQMNKRIKKRKSAPVLNEIFEENEGEGDHTAHNSTNQVSDSALAYRHATSITAHTRRIHAGRPVFLSEDIVPELNVRQGRPSGRRRSHKSSGSETSDEDSESRRTSRTNLSTTALNMLNNRIRRDSSGDRDQGGGNSGDYGKHPGRKSPHGSSSHTESTYDEDVSHDNNASGEHDDSEGFKENNCDNNLVDVSKLHNKNNSSCTYIQNKDNEVLNNMVLRGRRVAKHKAPCAQITNIFEKRSKSAESNSTTSTSKFGGSQTSSARSSCSNLSIGNRKRVLSSRVCKNSSSTMSDTGLVLRLHHLRKARVQASVMPRSPSSGSFTSLGINIYEDPTQLFRPSSEGNVRNLNMRSDKNSRQNSFNRNSLISVHPCIPESGGKIIWNNMKFESQEHLKRSNLSLASSTISASKFAVDPVNELLPPPASEQTVNGLNIISQVAEENRIFYESHEDTELILKEPFPNSPRNIRSFFSILTTESLFRKKTSVSTSEIETRKTEWNIGDKEKSLPGSVPAGLHDIKIKNNRIRSQSSKSDGDLVIHKLKVDCCNIM